MLAHLGSEYGCFDYSVNNCIIFIHVETTADVVYELVAEPIQEQRMAQEQQDPVQGPVDSDVEQQLQGQPRSIIYYFKL